MRSLTRLFAIMLVLLSINVQAQVSVGDILCTDNTFVSAENFVASGKTAQGVVFFVDNARQHGWAVALNDASASTVTWGSPESLCFLGSYGTNPQQVYADTAATYRNDSIYRSAMRFEQMGAFTAEQYATAVYLAHQQGSGWILPSIGQMLILYSNMPEINRAIDVISGATKMNGNGYWSCTEENAGVVGAWMLNYDGSVNARPKGDRNYVRAIRNF